MALFRSEDHVDRWCRRRGVAKGAVFSLPQLWELARRWYDDRLEHDWRRKTVAERQRILEEVGLVGPFWQIEGVSG
jgi:hypothetical protein